MSRSELNIEVPDTEKFAIVERVASLFKQRACHFRRLTVSALIRVGLRTDSRSLLQTLFYGLKLNQPKH